MIFGDSKNREDWKNYLLEHNEKDSVAENSWICIASTSEYDFYFMNVNKDSENYQNVRRMVNNYMEEIDFSYAPFDNFIENI